MCLKKFTSSGGGSLHLTVCETQFEGWVYATFISIFCFNDNLSLVSEKCEMYTKLDVKKNEE